ncbi:hypothetical protein MCAP1_000343 [Malassezia caprae]|uniref:Exocyst complex component Sec3 PIP2-binding N-terminal domain-containing protein n=1 Tax=Malassezia caprae TaxID=1381934 RepID=A0AAF0E4Q1_9BASI|nr:hypothetical protein MCAP1_000343 [Malassezia caprae]
MGVWHVTTHSAPSKEPPAHHVRQERTLTFCNPWDSAVKPSAADLLQGLQWGARRTPSTQGESRAHTAEDHAALMPVPMPIETPDFSYDPSAARARATWLGHAGVLVQLPPVAGLSRPVRALFDPIFSQRSSPSPWWGPQRTYAAPCKVSDLPTIDFVFISHNHYDHLDISTIEQLWAHFSDTVHFFVPLKNKEWLLQLPLGLPADRITELDWWDEAQCTVHASEAHVRVVCTPAQHGSGRAFYDAGHTLWSSWVLAHGRDDIFRVFFSGDSGFCMHKSDEEMGDPPAYPECPAFREIAQRIGAPDLSFLPVSVGATYAYLKSFDPLPEWLSPVPRLHDGLTGANHMTAPDAVRVFQQMHETRAARPPLAVAIHWGTFIKGPEDIMETVYRLQQACAYYGIALARHIETLTAPTLALLHHGQSVKPVAGAALQTLGSSPAQTRRWRMSDAFAAALRARVADNEYISHIKVREYEEVAQGVAAGTHKTRYILLSASPSQRRAFVYKARRNANGSFSIGKEWDAAQARELSLEPPSWIVITFSRAYRWEVDPAHDPVPFLTNLAIVVYKMTKHAPALHGWSLSSEAMMEMGGAPAPRAPAEASAPVAPVAVPAPAPAAVPVAAPAPALAPIAATAAPSPVSAAVPTPAPAPASAPVSRVTVPMPQAQNPAPASAQPSVTPTTPMPATPASPAAPRPLLQRKLTRPAAAQPLNMARSSTGAEDPALSQVEDMLEGFEWKGQKATESRHTQVGTADVIEARLLEELAALDASGIHAMVEPDDRVKAVLHGLDDALLQLDRLDASLGGSKMQLLALSEDIAYIEGQNRGLQVQMTNRQLLAQEMDVLLSTITVDRQAMQKLATTSLSSGSDAADMEAAAVSLYKSLLQARPDQQAQASEVAAMAQHLAQAEALAREFNTRVVSEFEAVLSDAVRAQLQDPALIQQASREASLPSHERMEQSLGKLCGLCLYLKETTPDLFEQLTQTYLRGAAHCYGTEMQRAFQAAAQQRGAWRDTEDCAPGQALQRLLSSLLPRVQAEQAFLVDLLQINDASFTFADYMDLDPYFRHRAAVTQPMPPQTPYEAMARAVQQVFAGLVPEMDAFVAQARSASPSCVVGLLVEVQHAQRRAASQPEGYALADLLDKVSARLSSELGRQLEEQVRMAEKTQVTVKKRGGLLPIVHAFPTLVRRWEGQLGGADGLPVRAMVDRGYERVIRAILAAIQSLPPREAGADDDKGQLNHAVLLIENAYHLVVRIRPGTPPNAALVQVQAQAEALLERSRADYVKAVLRRPIGKVVDFGRGVEALLASMPANEVPLHHAYSKSTAKKLVRDHTAKDLRKGIEALSKRVQKHFDDEEPTTSMQVALERDEVSHVLAQVWTACEAQCITDCSRT